MVKELVEPHSAAGSAESIWSRWRAFLLEGGKITLNLTGGTTGMQILVETLAHKARLCGARVERLYLVDRRSQREQQAHPWVEGEIYRLGSSMERDEEE